MEEIKYNHINLLYSPLILVAKGTLEFKRIVDAKGWSVIRYCHYFTLLPLYHDKAFDDTL